jgi:hypothetical protein
VLVAGLLLFLLPLQDVFGIFPLPCVKHFSPSICSRCSPYRHTEHVGCSYKSWS